MNTYTKNIVLIASFFAGIAVANKGPVVKTTAKAAPQTTWTYDSYKAAVNSKSPRDWLNARIFKLSPTEYGQFKKIAEQKRDTAVQQHLIKTGAATLWHHKPVLEGIKLPFKMAWEHKLTAGVLALVYAAYKFGHHRGYDRGWESGYNDPTKVTSTGDSKTNSASSGSQYKSGGYSKGYQDGLAEAEKLRNDEAIAAQKKGIDFARKNQACRFRWTTNTGTPTVCDEENLHYHDFNVNTGGIAKTKRTDEA